MKDLKINEGYLNDCDVETYKFLVKLQDIEYDYNFILFMKMFSGTTSIMGVNFWKTLLKANYNNFKEYDDTFKLMNLLAVQSVVVFQTFNIALHKKAKHDTLKAELELEQMQGKG